MRRYIYIISSMRSGSTLLKALIATRPDATDLPETSFTLVPNSAITEKLIVLKKPAWYNEFDYPVKNSDSAKNIILIRHPYDTVHSLLEMNKQVGKNEFRLNDELFLVSYWVMVYRNIIDKHLLKYGNSLIVRYEDLVANPCHESSKIFKFIGSEDTSGTDTYLMPSSYSWRWGKDDGGEVIKTLKVKQLVKKRSNMKLLDILEDNDEVKFILDRFGYLSNSPFWHTNSF